MNDALLFQAALPWDQLSAQILHCLGLLGAYLVPCLLILIPIRFWTALPSYVFRKLLHFLAFTCVTMMILAAGSWQAAALTAVMIFPGTRVSFWLDKAGSLLVSLYMLRCGIKTIREQKR